MPQRRREWDYYASVGGKIHPLNVEYRGGVVTPNVPTPFMPQPLEVTDVKKVDSEHLFFLNNVGIIASKPGSKDGPLFLLSGRRVPFEKEVDFMERSIRDYMMEPDAGFKVSMMRYLMAELGVKRKILPEEERLMRDALDYYSKVRKDGFYTAAIHFYMRRAGLKTELRRVDEGLMKEHLRVAREAGSVVELAAMRYFMNGLGVKAAGVSKDDGVMRAFLDRFRVKKEGGHVAAMLVYMNEAGFKEEVRDEDMSLFEKSSKPSKDGLGLALGRFLAKKMIELHHTDSFRGKDSMAWLKGIRL